MNSQNILKFWGSKLDLKLDSSEFHDYEVHKTESDYNAEVLDFNTPITYTGLTINTTSLAGTDCERDTISLVEVDVTSYISGSTFSSYSWILPYSAFTGQLHNSDLILENDVYKYIDSIGREHYFLHDNNTYNDPISNPFSLNVSGFTGTGTTYSCYDVITGDDCCPQDPIPTAKPWAYQINHGAGADNCSYKVQRRNPKGWTIDLVLNKTGLPWSDGNMIYYWGVRNETSISNYADNNLSFSFTNDGRVRWQAVRYSGICNTETGYTESYYISSGQTPVLCTNGTSRDFNLTIAFERNSEYTDCNLENDGGWNDLIPGIKTIPYTDTVVTAVTSTQITTYSEVEELNKKWAFERSRRLGTLKIYLNGRVIYKLKNWEEVIPSTRGNQPFIQSWAGGTEYSGGIHNLGTSCFNFKRVQYYEEPLDYVHVRHHYLVSTKPNYTIIECHESCDEEMTGFINCEKNCYYWNTYIAQSNLNRATGNTIYNNNVVYIDRTNCQLDVESKQYSVSGLTYWTTCMPTVASYDIYYYVNDVKTTVTGLTNSHMEITEDCCDLDKRYKLTVTGDLHKEALGYTEADLYVNDELVFHWDETVFWVINPDVWQYGLNKGDTWYLDFKPDLCAPENGNKILKVYSGATNVDTYSWDSPISGCTGPVLSGYTTPTYTVYGDMTLEINCPTC
jgi:hypothetical protein